MGQKCCYEVKPKYHRTIIDSPIIDVDFKMPKYICKIKTKTQNDSGIFFKFDSDKSNNWFYCLISNEHIITKEMIRNGEEIEVSYDIFQKNIIVLNKERYTKTLAYNNLDLIVIQILPNDNIDDSYFFIVKDNIDGIKHKTLINNSISVLHYFEEESLKRENREIKNIENNEFSHSGNNIRCTLENPILLKDYIKDLGINNSENIEIYSDFIYSIFDNIKNDLILKNNIESDNHEEIEKKDEDKDKNRNEYEEENKYENKIIKKLFWIGSEDKYQDIENILSKNQQENLNFFPFNNVKNAFDAISKIKFEIIFIVISENLYQDYLSIFNDVKSILTCFPICIIYSLNNTINNNSDNFIGFAGFINSSEKLIIFIHDYIKSANRKIQLNPKTGVTIDYNNTLTFEKIRNNDDLIIPTLYVLYKKLEGNENIINDEDIYKFNNILVNNHFDDKISKLIIPLNAVKNIPLDIASKFWIRYYTCESSFYPYMNSQSMRNNHENYEIFVRAMYKGIETKFLQTEYNISLYRCQLISKEEIDILEKNLILVYSRAFLSFSKDKNRAINFLKKGNNYLTPVMFIINSINLEEAYSSNADTEQFSVFSQEKEVLFFPFSSFIVDEKIDTQIIKGIETKIVSLNYLGKYRKDIENKINALNENKIKELLFQDSNFVKDISSIKLNENKVEMSQNVLNKSIQRVVNKVREETLIKNKEIIHQEPVIDKDKEINFINPYEIFNINKEEIESSLDKDLKFSRGRDTNPYGDATITEKYKKLKELNPSNKKTLLLSYYMIFNIEKCESFSRNEFYIKNKDQFYYVIMDDLENLKKIYEADKYIIETKDNYYRNLLHYAVIGEYYEICEFLLNVGINYDEPDFFNVTALYHSNGKIKDLLIKYGSRKSVYNTDAFKSINVKKSDDDKIGKIYQFLFDIADVNQINSIYSSDGKKLIGKRLIRSYYQDAKEYRNNNN